MTDARAANEFVEVLLDPVPQRRTTGESTEVLVKPAQALRIGRLAGFEVEILMTTNPNYTGWGVHV